MADKKQKEPLDRNSENEALERHVDELMDPSLPDPVPGTPSQPSGAPALPALNIFAGHDDVDADGITDKPARKSRKKKADVAAVAAATNVEEDTAPDAAETVADANETPDVTSETLPAADADGEPVRAAVAINSDEQLPGYPPLDEEAADEAVDDILAKESDKLLEIPDEEPVIPAVAPKTPRQRLTPKAFFRKWWTNKWARYGTLLVLLLGAATAGALPASRYYLLNTAGVRVGASVTVIDSTTDLPLKNVSVTLGNKKGMTNSDGIVRLKELELGDQQLTVQQVGFAKVSHLVTLGLGSNPLGDTELKATGVQYKFKLTDFLNGKPVKNAEVNSGDANAQSDDKGIVVLTLGKIEAPTLTTTIAAVGYRSEKLVIDSLKAETTNVSMVNKQKEVFISKQSGKYDLYKIDIDGKNKQLLLAGTGLERDQMTLVANAAGDKVALISSREDKRNGEGYSLDTLTVVDVKKAQDGRLSIPNGSRSSTGSATGWYTSRSKLVQAPAIRTASS
jgi:hypothetical protein